MTYWYGIDAGNLPKDRQLGLLANLPRLHAQETLLRKLYDPTDFEQVYALTLQAWGDDELAQKEKLASMKRLVRQETEAARAGRAS